MSKFTLIVIVSMIFISCDESSINEEKILKQNQDYLSSSVYLSDTVTNEEYEIYSKAISAAFSHYDEIHFVGSSWYTDRPDRYYNSSLVDVPDLDSLMLKRFRLTDYPFISYYEDKFPQVDGGPKIWFLKDSVFNSFEVIGGEAVWDAYFSNYPNFDATFKVSRVGFNKDHTLAMFRANRKTAYFAGESYSIIVRKVDGEWKLESYHSVSIAN